MILSCNDIKKAYGAEDVLKSVSFLLEEGEKAAVVGVNGAGKTTLFRVLCGELPQDGGEVSLKKGASLGYLSQISDLGGTNTVYDELLTVFAGVISLEDDMRRLETQMGTSSGGALTGLLQKYDKMTREYEAGRGYTYKSLVRGVIKGLGFTDAETRLELRKLSGGQKTRVSLGKLLLAAPDILLLDEPTNHLDIEAVAWLEDYLLKVYTGSVLIISHDRYFLDKVASKIIEIEYGFSKVYSGNYAAYAYRKELDRDILVKHFVDQQKEIKRQEEIIKRFRSYGQEWSIRRAKTREKMLGKVKRLELPPPPQKIRIILEPRRHCGHDVLHVENLSKSFSNPLFNNVSFDIFRGESVALIGPNGIGKTTLLSILMGRTSGNGLIRFGAGVKIGYYDQEQQDISDNKTIMEEIYDAFPSMTQTEIRTSLAAFMFCGDDVFRVIGTLSGGEKGRVALAKLMLGYSNFLLLDEPTNHLDMFSKEILEEAVRNYTGTIFYVSHDRYFINATANKIIELSSNGATVYDGDYDYYLEKKSQQNGPADSSNNPAEPAGKTDWLKKKEEQSEERKKASRLLKLEKEIEEGEALLKTLEERLMRDDIATNMTLAQQAYAQKTHLEERIHNMYREWDELSSP